jgi:hypothetical protein
MKPAPRALERAAHDRETTACQQFCFCSYAFWGAVRFSRSALFPFSL